MQTGNAFVIYCKRSVMKPVFWSIAILFLFSLSAIAQTKSGKSKKQISHSSNVAGNKDTSKKPGSIAGSSTLNTTASYAAKANNTRLSLLKNNYTVTDPILTTLNARAGGANIQFNKSGIVGMPKRAYGFANGHVLLSTTGAVTSGTQTGSGAVGTGTSLATFGSIGAPMNVNGKSPYAGVNMWGNAMNMEVINSDSSVRLSSLKKQ